MKHSEENREVVLRLVDWLGISLQDRQWDQLQRYAGWLETEAIAAGGLGRREGDRVWERHLADSLAFARGWIEATPPRRLLDVGAGVGLPGIPLAILWPETRVTLLDRSARRADLARRATRLLQLTNVEVREGDVVDVPREWDGAVFRAVFSPERCLAVADSVLTTTGTAVIGLRGSDVFDYRPQTPTGRITDLVDVPATILDGSVALLIMSVCE